LNRSTTSRRDSNNRHLPTNHRGNHTKMLLLDPHLRHSRRGDGAETKHAKALVDENARH
jgi:hypothetical protein